MKPAKLKDLTPEQLKTYLSIQRINMGWIFFLVVLTVFVILIGIIIWMVTKGVTGVATMLTLVNGVLGLSIKQIGSNLFPKKSA